MKQENIEEKAIYALVYGRVQGVGFRYSTANKGKALRLTGYARNMSDGSVEVVAEGDSPSIEKMIRFLKQGPPGSRVDRLDCKYKEVTGFYRRFSIEY